MKILHLNLIKNIPSGPIPLWTSMGQVMAVRKTGDKPWHPEHDHINPNIYEQDICYYSRNPL